MRVTYDPEAGALYIQLRQATPVDSIDIEPGVTADLDTAGHVIGIEVLDASEKLGTEAVASFSFEQLTGNLKQSA